MPADPPRQIWRLTTAAPGEGGGRTARDYGPTRTVVGPGRLIAPPS